jgi:hypothetical protein
MANNHPLRGERSVLVDLLHASTLAEALPPASLDALAAILTAPLSYAWVGRVDGRGDLAKFHREMRGLGIRPDEARRWLAGLEAEGVDVDGLADLEGAGLVATFESCDVLAVTLTPLGARRIGVELVEFGVDDDPATRWGVIDPRPGPFRCRAQRGAMRPSILEMIACGRPGPVEQAIINEAALLKPWEAAPAIRDAWSDAGIRLFGQPLRIDHRRCRPLKPAAPKPKGRPKAKPRPSTTRANSFDLAMLAAALG